LDTALRATLMRRGRIEYDRDLSDRKARMRAA
jgi:hypothetical protein